MDDLLFVDRHCVDVHASRARTWVALGDVLSEVFGGIRSAGFASVLGTSHSSVSGPPLEVGSTIVGFRVTRSERERCVVLSGEHRFSRYALTFELGERELCASTRAVFPGPHGTAYKAVVLGTGDTSW